MRVFAGTFLNNESQLRMYCTRQLRHIPNNLDIKLTTLNLVYGLVSLHVKDVSNPE